MVNKVEAIRLRRAGMKYPQIAVQLGCSEIWCRKNLVGVEPDGSVFDGGSTKELAIGILEDALTKLKNL